MQKRNWLGTILAAGAVLAVSAAMHGSTGAGPLEEQVRHQLMMLPYYNVFDNLAYRVDGARVTLFGQVTRPSLKSDAESAVRRIEGVAGVDSYIEVLRLSPDDDRIRTAVYRAIYLRGPLQRFRLNAVLPIHIIVRNGNITLEGIVANEGD